MTRPGSATPLSPPIWPQCGPSIFDFIMQQGIGHLLLGEFGIKDRTADSNKSGQCSIHCSRPWARPTHGPSGAGIPTLATPEGILQTDWLTPWDWKMSALKPYLAPMIGQ